MKNRIASLFLVFALLMSLCVSVAARDNPITVQSGGAERFTDVPTDHWAYAYINKVVGSGLFNGKTPTTFEPSNAMTRSQFVMVMARMEGRSDLEGQVLATQPFPDVTTTRRAAGPIAWAVEQGFVYGFGDGTFKPDSPINRGQFAALIHRYITAKGYTNLNAVSPEPAQFTDAASVSSAFTADVEYARVHGLLTGYSDGTVRSANPITRAAIAAILARFLDLVGESKDLTSGDYYVPLLDYPRPDNGDSGNTPVETPNDYSASVKVVVNGGTHGSAPVVAVTRDGKTVAPDDVQAGDRVTITYKPDSGYVASVRVRDANKKVVNLNKIDANSSWFTMPAAQPVTITVTYSKESSGGGGGGGGGGGSSSSGGGQTVYRYTFDVAVTGGNGVAYMLTGMPQDGYTVPAKPGDYESATVSSGTKAAERTAYAVFVPNKGYKFDMSSATVAGNAVANNDVQTVTLKRTNDDNAETVTASYIAVTRTTASNNPSVKITGAFVEDSGGQVTPPNAINWTVTAQGEGALFQIVEIKTTKDPATGAETETPAPTAAVTAENGKANENSDEWKDVGANAAGVYVAISPQSSFKFAGAGADSDLKAASGDNADVSLVQAYTLNAQGALTGSTNRSENDALRVYRVNKSGLAEGNNATTLNIEMAITQGVYYTYPVTVIRTIDGEKVKDETNSVTVGTETTYENVPGAKVESPATWGDNVTVTAGQTSGYGVGYKVVGFKVTRTDTNADVSYTPPQGDTSAPNPLEYSFTMPNSAVQVEIQYEQIKDEPLEYSLEVTFTSGAKSGSMVVNIDGTPYALPNDEYKTSDNVYTIKIAGENITKAWFAEKYPDKAANDDWTLPVYVADTPIAADKYEYEASKNVAVEKMIYVPQKDANGPPAQYFTLQPGKNTLEVDFTRIHTYGYNLTVIGNGAVTVDFNGEYGISYPGSATAPQTFTSGNVITNSKTVTVHAQANLAASNLEATLDVSLNGKALYKDESNQTAYDFGDAITIPDDQIVDLVVSIHRANREAVPFKVTVQGNGSATVKAEGGKILPESATTAANATADLKTSKAVSVSDPVTSTAIFYAFEDSFITITPTPDKSDDETLVYKVRSITARKDNGGTLPDALSSDGYSFQLTESSSATVTFGTLTTADAYAVNAKAPYKTPALHSESTKIPQTATILQVLYSLNNGQAGRSTTDSNGIVNALGTTPDLLNQVLGYYLVKETNRNKDTNRWQLGEKALQDMLEESVSATLASNMQSMMDAQKKSMTSSDATVNAINSSLNSSLTEVGAELKDETAASDANSLYSKTHGLEVSGAAKSSIINQVLTDNETLKNAFDAGNLTEDQFTIKVDVEPILLAASDEKSDAKGKSVETQLKAFIKDYLNKLDIILSPNPNVKVPTTAVTVTTARSASNDNSGAQMPPTITISATADFTNNKANWPAINKAKLGSFSDYSGQLNVWARVSNVQVTINNPTYASNAPSNTDISLLYSTDKFVAKGQNDPIKDSIDGQLVAVDAAVDNKWNETLSGADMLGTTGSMSVDFAQVLTQDILDQVVDNVLDDAVTTLTEKVDSIKDENGKAPTTRAAVMNLYHDFVVFNPDAPVDATTNKKPILQLKTDGSANLTVGEVDGKNLVLTVDFAEILRDKTAALNESVPYEKLVDLLVALRDGISTDIRNNSKDGKSAESVFASLIENQIANNRGTLTATKWGEPVTSFTGAGKQVERRELATLLASLIMAPLEADMQTAWAKFEAKGYTDVQFSLELDSSKRDSLSGIVKALNRNMDATKYDFGFQIKQNVN